MGTKTEWNDLILTAKGWYKSSGSIVKDFAIALEQNENRTIRIPNKEDAKKGCYNSYQCCNAFFV